MVLDTEHDKKLRLEMAEFQIRRRGISDPTVLEVFRQIPRQAFIPPEHRFQAYDDGPVPIGFGQTISQPYIVALMTESLELNSSLDVLEIGTGCGYQTAILARLAQHVYSIERIPELLQAATITLQSLGFQNIQFHLGDGSKGWPQTRTFDRILVAAAPESIHQSLLEQLAPEGKMVIPIGPSFNQNLILVHKMRTKIQEKLLCPCRFVPLIENQH